MQFSEKWLSTLVKHELDSAALEHALTMAGLEVEESRPAAPPFSGVVVAQIVATEPHPAADKLKVCQVDAGVGERLQIVCGAPNAAAGMKVPLARVGASLPGMEIKAAKLRGVESFGMLCSARELGLSEDHAGLLSLPNELEPGADFRTALDLDDRLLTIKLTPNRADCLSMLGIAREVAALSSAALNAPEIKPVVPQLTDRREIVLDAPHACPRYCGRVLKGVNAAAPTPDWMKQRLERSGIRSISVLVDITNYVMLELGQPLHVFDNDQLSGSIHVRYPIAGESLLLLNEQTVTPAADTLVIADEARVLALAGIMGGEESGVTVESTNVFLESAFFAPEAIAGRARAYGFVSDASHRFERGVDFELPGLAIERASSLILRLCGGAAGPVVETASLAHLPQRPQVALDPVRVRRLLGVELSDAAMTSHLRSINLQVEERAGHLLVTPPSYRFDIVIEEDLIEEVARLHGYDEIPSLPPVGRMAMLPRSDARRTTWEVRHAIAGRDYQEVITYAFVDEAWERDFCGANDPIRLANPIASQMSVMRSSLIPGLIEVMRANRKRQQTRVRLFEIGRCFERKADGDPVTGYHQPVQLAVLASGSVQSEQWGVEERRVDFFDVKADLESLFPGVALTFSVLSHPALHPGRAAAVWLNGKQIGMLGEIHPVWVQRYELGVAPVVFEIEMEAALAFAVPSYTEVSRMPIVSRDLALVVDQDLSVARVLAVLNERAGALVRSIELFDLYHGKGIDPDKKSLAFRVLMQDTHRTLEDAEVDAAISAIVSHAEASLGARLRG